MLDRFDFSRFDRVASSIMVLSPQLEMIYSNVFAKRQCPLLTSSDVFLSQYDSTMLQKVSQSLSAGYPVRLPLEGIDIGAILLDPVFDPHGRLIYVCLYVESITSEFNNLLPIFSDGELLFLLQREVAKPINYFVQSLTLLEENKENLSDGTVMQTLTQMRRRMLHMCLFFARAECSAQLQDGAFAMCDVDNVLSICENSFPPMKYKPFGACYIPMERDAMILVITDVLSNLCVRQNPGCKITVTLSSDDRGSSVTFASGPLIFPIDQPCNDDYDGVDIGLFSVRRRVELVGGRVSIKSRPRGAVTITLEFPRVLLQSSSITVGDSFDSLPSQLECFALEYLNLLLKEE